MRADYFHFGLLAALVALALAVADLEVLQVGARGWYHSRIPCSSHASRATKLMDVHMARKNSRPLLQFQLAKESPLHSFSLDHLCPR